MKAAILVSLYCLWTAVGHAASSAHYALTPVTLDGGGGQSGTAHYASISSITAGGAVNSAQYLGRTGFTGQLYDPIALELYSEMDPLVLQEESEFDLWAATRFDDDSFLIIDPATLAAQLALSFPSGPLQQKAGGGRPRGVTVTVGPVYEDAVGTIEGVFGGFTVTFSLTILDTFNDNFGSYAGDLIDDIWQVNYFGEENPQGLALADPDADGQNNLFEFTAGIIPTSASSRFALRIERVPGVSTARRLVFSPIAPDREYLVEVRDTHTSPWTVLTGGTQSETGAERAIITTPVGLTKFYRVQVRK